MSGAETTSISPMLSVRRGAKAIEFYKTAFGAEELFRIGDEENGVVAQMSVGGAEFWLADEAPEYLNFSPASLGTEFRGATNGRKRSGCYVRRRRESWRQSNFASRR